MISVKHTPIASVIRESWDTESGLLSSRFIGSYETFKEAEFIAKKAEKMEKASVLNDKIKDNPELEFKLKLSDICLVNVTYNIYGPVTDDVTPCYTNGKSNVLHYLDRDNYHERKLTQLEDLNLITFEQFVLNNEERYKL